MTSTKMALAIVVCVAAATMAASAQTQVFVPGTTNGGFGNPIDEINPLVPAITVSGPGTITVTYVSGTVTDAGGVNTGPDGVATKISGYQLPLEEAIGVESVYVTNLDALIGIFVPATRVNRTGFQAVDGTKGAVAVGIIPETLFFIGTGITFSVKQAGTLFLGINDCWMSDNSGSFTVTVSAQ